MLRQLAQYHAKDPNNLFMVRLAQVMTPRGRLGLPVWGTGGGGVLVVLLSGILGLVLLHTEGFSLPPRA